MSNKRDIPGVLYRPTDPIPLRVSPLTAFPHDLTTKYHLAESGEL